MNDTRVCLRFVKIVSASARACMCVWMHNAYSQHTRKERFILDRQSNPKRIGSIAKKPYKQTTTTATNESNICIYYIGCSKMSAHECTNRNSVTANWRKRSTFWIFKSNNSNDSLQWQWSKRNCHFRECDKDAVRSAAKHTSLTEWLPPSQIARNFPDKTEIFQWQHNESILTKHVCTCSVWRCFHFNTCLLASSLAVQNWCGCSNRDGFFLFLLVMTKKEHKFD